MKKSIRKNIKMKSLKKYLIIPLILFVFAGGCFITWQFIPKHDLSVVVLDKTVPATAADNASYLDDVSNNYRKHKGLYWLLDYLKINNPDTGHLYNYKNDYYGHKINENNKITETTSIVNVNAAPDLLYLSDTYGVEINDDHGITEDEMNTISMCHSNGSVVIGEQDILTTATDKNVHKQLENLFGMNTTGWVGRYIFDLQDMTDVPYWAPDMWQKKYGQEWQCSGPGILLVSSDGDILVLEEKTDFESKNLFKISIENDYKDEFGSHSVNFYNWFELIEAEYDTEIMASYSFNVNKTGAEKLAAVSDTTTFAAVTRKNYADEAPCYYFAGDFNDFVTDFSTYKFCFADYLYRLLSYNRDGDVTNFYWNFYEPMMKKIIKSIKDNPEKKDEQICKQISRVANEGFEVLENNEWKKLDIKGFNINGEMPGNEKFEYSRDYESYYTLIQSVAQMNANCIRTYDLLPPEFYRALYEVNKHSETKIYLIQGILTPSDIDRTQTIDKMAEIKQNIDDVFMAVHGEGMTPGAGSRNNMAYMYNVSDYVIAYIYNPEITRQISDKMMTGTDRIFSYDGTYISSSENAVEALSAQICDYMLTKQLEKYNYQTPVSISYGTQRLKGAGWTEDLSDNLKYSLSNLVLSDSAEQLYFISNTINTDDKPLLDNSKMFDSYADNIGSYPYGGYIQSVKALYDKPVLIDGVGLSTNSDMFEAEKQVNGLSEKDQGDGLVRILSAVKQEGYIGALIADLNDNWSASSEEFKAYTIPKADDGLWQNTTDRAETTGVVAADSLLPEKVSMELNDFGDMKQLQISSNETYIYATILMANEIDFDKGELILGIDTYQRNNGEYFYDKAYYANSLSGMEYVVKFESRQSATLYVADSYNRNKGNYQSQESYQASYDVVSVLNYGDFSTSNTHFYQTGMTLHMRIPWAMLNFTDPSKMLVINGKENDEVKTTATDGMIFSLLIGDKETKDTAYIFPDSKQHTGYKTLKLQGWNADNVSYVLRKKNSTTILKRYFDSY